MYEYIDFGSVSNNKITEFLQLYNYTDLTPKVWQSISTRIKNTVNPKYSSKKHKYHRIVKETNKVKDRGIEW